MNRVVVLIALALVLYFAGKGIYRMLASDEVKIGWLLDSMADNFSRSRPRACTDGLAEDFVETVSGLRKRQIHAYLVQLAFRARDTKTGEFLYRVELPPELRRIEVQAGGGKTSARVETVARFHKLRGEERDLVWEVRIEADLEKRDVWKVVRANHETLRGRRLE